VVEGESDARESAALELLCGGECSQALVVSRSACAERLEVRNRGRRVRCAFILGGGE
jgi:hypothetical protein